MKLSSLQVEVLRHLLDCGEDSLEELAKKAGLSEVVAQLTLLMLRQNRMAVLTKDGKHSVTGLARLVQDRLPDEVEGEAELDI